MPVVKFTQNLKRYYPDLQPISVENTSIPEIINAVDNKYPGLSNYILDEQGNLRKHVHIFIGENMIKDRDQLSDEVSDSDEIYIMQALSGG